MARKPNYAFERNNKAKAKAEKREAKRLAKLASKGKNELDEPSEQLEGEVPQTTTHEAADDPAS